MRVQHSSPVQFFRALILSKMEYTLPAIADSSLKLTKSRLDAFSERQNDVFSAILICSAFNSSIEQIRNSLS